MTESDAPRPGGNVAKRTLQFFWLVDCSYSMDGKKIQILNQSVRDVLPEIRSALKNYPTVQMQMRSIRFSSDASWHIGPEPVNLQDFEWKDLAVDGMTSTSRAIRMLTSELSMEKMPQKGYPPVCILLSDGYCTDPQSEYLDALKALDGENWGKKAVRLSIAIGEESDYDEDELLRFISPGLRHEVGVLKAKTPEQLIQYIKWASVTASVSASQGKSRNREDDNQNNDIPASNVVMGPPPIISDSSEPF